MAAALAWREPSVSPLQQFPPEPRPPSVNTRTRGGRSVPAGSKVSRRSPFAGSGSTRSTLAVKVVTFGRSRRGAPTHSALAQMRAHPSASASPSRPKARSSRPPSKAKPAMAMAAPTQSTASHSRGPSSANQHAMPAPKPITSQMGSCPRSRSRRLPPPPAPRQNAPSNSPEHAVEDAHPLC